MLSNELDPKRLLETLTSLDLAETKLRHASAQENVSSEQKAMLSASADEVAELHAELLDQVIDSGADDEVEAMTLNAEDDCEDEDESGEDEADEDEAEAGVDCAEAEDDEDAESDMGNDPELDIDGDEEGEEEEEDDEVSDEELAEAALELAAAYYDSDMVLSASDEDESEGDDESEPADEEDLADEEDAEEEAEGDDEDLDASTEDEDVLLAMDEDEEPSPDADEEDDSEDDEDVEAEGDEEAEAGVDCADADEDSDVEDESDDDADEGDEDGEDEGEMGAHASASSDILERLATLRASIEKGDSDPFAESGDESTSDVAAGVEEDGEAVSAKKKRMSQKDRKKIGRKKGRTIEKWVCCSAPKRTKARSGKMVWTAVCKYKRKAAGEGEPAYGHMTRVVGRDPKSKPRVITLGGRRMKKCKPSK